MLNTWKICIQVVLATVTCLCLSSCVGAPLAQQVISSAVMHGADNLIDNAYQAQQRNAIQNQTLPDMPPDPYWSSFISAGFERITPNIEPLPDSSTAPSAALPAPQRPNQPSPTTESLADISPLVRVEVWNLLIGEEKHSALAQAYLLGETGVPPKENWNHISVATGEVIGEDGKEVIFIVPRQLGKLHSGQQVIVELKSINEIGIARYLAE